MKNAAVTCHAVTRFKNCDAGIKEKTIGKIALKISRQIHGYIAEYGKVTIFSAFPTLASGASIARGSPPPKAAPSSHRPCAHAGTISGRSPNPLTFSLRKEKVSQKKRNQKYNTKKGDFSWDDYNQNRYLFT